MNRNPSFWRERRVFVTGASGFLGGHLVRHLLARGARVVCLVRDEARQSMLFQDELKPQFQMVSGNVCDAEVVERTLREHAIETVFHLAAQALVHIAKRDATATFQTNVAGTWTVLDACRRCTDVRQIVVASSDKAYGDAIRLPYDEAMSLNAIHPYDVSKACADWIARCFAKTYGLPVAITRCGNFYGPGDWNWNRIVPGTLRSLLLGERPVIRSDGSLIRDYFYVEDGAEAYILLAEQLSERPELAGEAFNFANEQPHTVLQLVERITQLVASDLRPLVLNESTHEIRAQHLSAAKAQAELGWRPLFDLSAGLARTIPWYRQTVARLFPTAKSA